MLFEFSTAPIGARIAPIELFDVELAWREYAARAALSTFRTQVGLIGGIAAPFAETAPEVAKQTRSRLCGLAHQSSPWAVPE